MQNTTSFPGNKLWAFVNSSYTFPVPTNPFPYENSRSYSSASAAVDQNFIGMKLGDVNNSWDPSVAKEYASNIVTMHLDDKQAMNGDIITVPVTVSNFNLISGFQYTIAWNSSVLEFVEASNASLNMDYGTTQISGGKLTALWATENLLGNSLSDGSTIFELKFRVIGNSGESTMVSINSDMTSVEAVNSEMQLIAITPEAALIKVMEATGISSIIGSGYQLMQNEPNPFADLTHISFSLPVDDKVIISVFDIFGKKVAEFSRQYLAGVHSIIWDGTDDEGNKLSVGTYYYRMQSGKYVNVKKMVLLK